MSAGKFGLCYVARSLAPVVNVDAGTAPLGPAVLCDLCIITSVRSTLILTVVDEVSDAATSTTARYNHALSRGIVGAVLDFTQENFSVSNGILKKSDLHDQESFADRIQTIEKNSSKYCVSDSLNMTESKCLTIVTAFLRAVTVIRNTSIFSTNETRREELWFLTKEQFVVLTENLGSCAVFVDAVSSSGYTLLMVELANRLEKIGRTMLISQQPQIQDG